MQHPHHTNNEYNHTICTYAVDVSLRTAYIISQLAWKRIPVCQRLSSMQHLAIVSQRLPSAVAFAF